MPLVRTSTQPSSQPLYRFPLFSHPHCLHTQRSLFTVLLRLIPLLLCLFFAQISLAQAEVKDFGEFSLDLPAGWDGSERQGFASKDRNEYMLTLGLKDETKEHYLAYISLYLLPNKRGLKGQDWAKDLAEKQAESTSPTQEGAFWIFSGDPRDKILKGRAKTHVTANTDHVLIIIVKDPGGNHAEEILATLTPKSKRAQRLLGGENSQKAGQEEGSVRQKDPNSAP